MTLYYSIVFIGLAFWNPKAQDSGTSLEDVIRRYEKGILRIEGVKEIVPDRLKGKEVITVRVETSEARDTVLLVTQEKLESYPVRIVLSKHPLSSPSGPKTPDKQDPQVAQVCAGCPQHCPPGPEGRSKADGGPSRAKHATEGRSPSKQKPEPACSHCPIHCKPPEDHATEVELGTPATPESMEPPPAGAEKGSTEDLRCDVARKLRGLPPLKTGRCGCEEILSTSNNPDKIRWAIDKGLPHWVSKEMPGVKGNAKTGISCPVHGTHSTSEFVCYAWVKHGTSCPMKDILSPKDLNPGSKEGSK